jgi:hypothetical protein
VDRLEISRAWTLELVLRALKAAGFYNEDESSVQVKRFKTYVGGLLAVREQAQAQDELAARVARIVV